MKKTSAGPDTVVIDRLYGEDTDHDIDFWLHCETLFSRSSLYRFEISPHRHESFFQILLISHGDGDIILGGVAHPIASPSAIIVPPQGNHGFRFSRDIQGFIITVLPEALSAAIRSTLRQMPSAPSLLPLAGAAAVEVANLVERVADEFAHRRHARNTMMEGYLSALLVLLLRLSGQDFSRPEPALTTNGGRMEKLSSLIARHFRSQQPTEFYARQLEVSPTHLNRIVRLETGLTLRQLIALRLTECAKQELIFSHATVQAIAQNLGFSDPAYFSRFFLRETGMTPRAWRIAERRQIAR